MMKLSAKSMLFAAAALPAAGIVQAKEKLPNIVLIFMDDMGYGDLGVTGAIGYSTPNLDRMAVEGMRFTQFYVGQGVSSASRAAIMTGCYPNRVGIVGALSPTASIGINANEMTMAELLKQKGYKTICIGKWHLGRPEQFLPLQNGFDEYFGLPYSNDMWPVNPGGAPSQPGDRKYKNPPLPLIEGNRVVRIIENMDQQSQLTTLYTERAVKFIRENRKNPFFLYMPHSMTHVPLAVSDKFKGKSEQGMFGDVMMEVDWSVGQVMQALRDAKIEDNTLVVFTSDNGPWLNYGNWAGSAGGLREGKATMWEGGPKVPCIMKWKGVIPEGVICNRLASTIDLLPTFAAITGAPLPTNKIDGVNILPLLKNEEGPSPRQYYVYYYAPNNLRAVRDGMWKLVFPHSYRAYGAPGNDGFDGPLGTGQTEMALYNLRSDPGERYNVIADHPDVVERLSKVADEYRRDLGDDLTGYKPVGKRPAGQVQ